MKNRLIHLGDVISTVLKNVRPSSDTGMIKVWDLWQTSVGEAIAREAKPGAFRDGTLIVHVSSSVWLHQLSFLKLEIIEKLNIELKSRMVKDIVFKIGKIHN